MQAQKTENNKKNTNNIQKASKKHPNTSHHPIIHPSKIVSYFLKPIPYPIGSMGLVYEYLHEWLIFMVNVGKYTVRPMDPMGTSSPPKKNWHLLPWPMGCQTLPHRHPDVMMPQERTPRGTQRHGVRGSVSVDPPENTSGCLDGGTGIEFRFFLKGEVQLQQKSSWTKNNSKKFGRCCLLLLVFVSATVHIFC